MAETEKTAVQEPPKPAAVTVPATQTTVLTDPPKPIAAQVTPAAAAATTTATKTPEPVKQPAAEAAKPGEAKPGEQKPVVPEKYDLKLPQGSLLDNARVEQVSALAKEKGLTNDQAQLVLDRESQAARYYADSAMAKHEANRKEWIGKIQADPTFGGPKFNESAAMANRVINKFAPELKPILNQTGYGDNYELFLAFARIGQAMGEDKFVPSGQPAAASKKSDSELFYGKKAGEAQ